MERNIYFTFIPSGILYEDKTCVIGNGVIIDPGVLLKEMADLAEKGITVAPKQLLISANAHLIMPYHQRLDVAREAPWPREIKSAPPAAASVPVTWTKSAGSA
jgi:adenylosuccinate synthase